jgi:hypothetical protein
MNCAYTHILKSVLCFRKRVAAPRGLWRVSRADQKTPLASNGANSPRILLKTCYDRLRFSYRFEKTNARFSSGEPQYGHISVLIFDFQVFTRIADGSHGAKRLQTCCRSCFNRQQSPGLRQSRRTCHVPDDHETRVLNNLSLPRMMQCLKPYFLSMPTLQKPR